MNRSQWMKGAHWTDRVPEFSVETKACDDMRPTHFNDKGEPIAWVQTLDVKITQTFPEFHEKK